MSKRPASREDEQGLLPNKKGNSALMIPRQKMPSPYWAEPGGDADPQNPLLELPHTVRKVNIGEHDNKYNQLFSGDDSTNRSSKDVVTDAEIEWMAAQQPLVYSPARLARDYGAQEAALMGSAIRAWGMPEETAGALACPGVGTRWSRFVAWWRQWQQEQQQDVQVQEGQVQKKQLSAKEALGGFARAIGRIRTYRALALDEKGLETILERDEIFPTGLLQPGVDATNLRSIVEKHGVRKVAACRLYISQMDQIGGIDPSYSLHDDWQTTSIIASGYASKKKKVHLFELDVPAIESLGWTMQDVSNAACSVFGEDYSPDKEEWFSFEAPASPVGVWLDATLQRTERFGLYGVTFLHRGRRLRNIFVFDSVAEIRKAVHPFVERMKELHHS